VRGFNGDVSMASGTDGRVTLSSGRSKLHVKSLPAEDFPDIKRPDATSTFEIDAGELLRTLAAVAHAQSDEQTRYYLVGIFMHVVDSQLVCVATDGRRLARHAMAAPDGSASMPSIIVGSPAVKAIMGLLKGASAATIAVS